MKKPEADLQGHVPHRVLKQGDMKQRDQDNWRLRDQEGPPSGMAMLGPALKGKAEP